jgi:hypothetical protein
MTQRPLRFGVSEDTVLRLLFSYIGRLWAGWKAIAHKIGNFQSRVLLNVFYFLILSPFALGVRLFADPLRIRRQTHSHWLHKETDLAIASEKGRRQF